VFVLFLLLLRLSIDAQVKETIIQNRVDQVGVKVKEDFKLEPYAQWFNPTYKDYKLDKRAIRKLKKHSKDFKIKVFMSVWCHDSKREVPHLYKILEAINFDIKNLEVIALNRSKKTPKNLQEGFNIVRTPTFIFYKNGKEIGRYVEIPRKILEKDILRIVSGKSYKHSYDKN
jgi:thiol-disulfide isomerase/thioredoxin